MTAKIIEHSDVNTLHARLLEEVPNGASVLDVGAGLAKYHELITPPRTRKLTLVDAHQPYVDDRRKQLNIEGTEILCEEVRGFLWDAEVNNRRWDIALGIDFIEHLDRGTAYEVIAGLKNVASKVILFTPEGNHPQEKDHYNMGGDHWQTHRSTWSAQDFGGLGFSIERWVDFHRWAADRGCDLGAIWAVWRKP